jgi:hypothetical protein
MREEGVRAIEEQSTHVIDDENETVTTLIDGKECAYVVFEKGIAACAIEKALNCAMLQFIQPHNAQAYRRQWGLAELLSGAATWCAPNSYMIPFV